MTQQTHRRRVGDTRTLLYATLVQPNTSGVDTVVNLTGLTVKFSMVNAATGTIEIVETTTGVTVETAASGTVKYDFLAAGVDTAGIYNAWFVVYDGAEADHIPVKRQDLRILIDSDTLTAEEAYEAAVA
jgi:hypothetical protein